MSMLMDLLRDLATNVIHGPPVLNSKTNLCNIYMSIHIRRKMVFSPFETFDLLDTCIFCKFLSL